MNTYNADVPTNVFFINEIVKSLSTKPNLNKWHDTIAMIAIPLKFSIDFRYIKT
ncbi:hypothetical protein VroAM7_39950 [Vibrio rotiferianus]|uniref:Uncharacterized protein n=1 Tax=Vibrio rotiferianus TaxID=190895 RepID=A0A510IC40_9VIBR|nr:hypothetical protein VroAM7_39950 [Vibrio rotiferianus]